MKILRCADYIPNSECNFTAGGRTNDAVIKKMFQHAEQEHAALLQNVSFHERSSIERKMNQNLNKQ